jgi:hypothetical protein
VDVGLYFLEEAARVCIAKDGQKLVHLLSGVCEAEGTKHYLHSAPPELKRVIVSQ